jgi:hypothetical protein
VHLLMVLGEVTLPHPTAHARTGRPRADLRPVRTVPGRLVLSVLALGGAVGPPVALWRRVVALAGLLAVRARLRPGRPVGPAGLTRPTGDQAEREGAPDIEPGRPGRTGVAPPGGHRGAGRDLLPRARPGSTWRCSRPKERWDDWVELDSKSVAARVEKRYMLVPTTCFNCESACGLLAYVDKDSMQVRKFEGNPERPARAAATAPRARPRSTRSPTRTGSCTR